MHMACYLHRLSEDQVKVHSFHGGLLGVLLNHAAVLRLDPLSTEKIKEVSKMVFCECAAVDLSCLIFNATSVAYGMCFRNVSQLISVVFER